MRRIGIAASKMAKGSLLFYNLYVVLIAFLCALFMFFIAGSAIALAMIVIGYIINGVVPAEVDQDWWQVIRLCMVTLTVVIGLATLFAIVINIKVRRIR